MNPDEQPTQRTLAEALAPIADADALGADSRIGPFRILRLLGRGGMGSVYLARQLMPVVREVALKLLAQRQTDARALTWFEMERHTLARMQHPAIAQIFDAGTTDHGLPWFAMEYVDGLPVTRYCDREALQLPARLRLFIEICRGVHHAHQKGVIHRDLKPSNLLVATIDGRPQPKIIDFGIATGVQRGGNPVDGAGTPEFMSPEQAGLVDGDVDTRSDVFSLGVVLFELLTGGRPFDSRSLEAWKAARNSGATPAITLRDPAEVLALPADQLAAIAERRGLQAAALPAALRGELTTILRKATATHRADRYDSAEALAADIGRFLRHEPLEAMPGTAWYRIRKFVRRRRLPVAMGTALLLALCAGLIGTLLALERAREAQQRAEAALERARSAEADAKREARAAAAVSTFLSEDLIGGVNVSLRGDARQITLLDAIRSAADTIGERFAEDPLTEAGVRLALGESLENLAERDAAQQQFDRALDLYRAALGPESPEALRAESAAINSRSHRGERLEAQTQLRALIPRMEAALGAEDPATLRAKNTLAILYWLLNQPDEGVPLGEAILASARRTLGPDHQVTLVAGNNLARLYRQQQRYAEAEALHRESIEARIRAYGPVNQMVFEARNDLAGLYRAWGRYPEAEASYRELLAGYREVLGPQHSSVAVVLNNLARTLANQRRHAESLPLYGEALEISLSATGFGAAHINTAAFRANRAISELALGRARVAHELLIQALAVMDQALPERHPQRVAALTTLAETETALGNTQRAAELREWLEAPAEPAR
ncbi:MAG: serine/threonine-protein kinase [Xanthomonadales bacterium]|jgi:non-specific serine/threonine protein kinase/serine/threonine-protein kinase|nr:serine/threonine-protein kinase [Xanthomonadales bacterium]